MCGGGAWFTKYYFPGGRGLNNNCVSRRKGQNKLAKSSGAGTEIKKEPAPILINIGTALKENEKRDL